MQKLRFSLLRGASWKVAALGLVGASALALGAQAQSTMAPSTTTGSPATSLVTLAKDPDQWVIPSGNYAAWRYSHLNQINTRNAKDLQVAWTMSTGTDRGLEGQPLVVGNMMYFQTSYPNYVSSWSFWAGCAASGVHSPAQQFLSSYRTI